MKQKFLLRLSVAALVSVSPLTLTPALAQGTASLQAELQAALQAGNSDTAMGLADRLLTQAETEQDYGAAGFAAYAKANLLEQGGDALAAAESYAVCGDHYAKMGSDAQALQCDYASAQANLAAFQTRPAIRQMKDIIKALKKIDQDRSAFAGRVYLSLAQETLPNKMDFDRAAQKERRKAADYADAAIAAMEASGLTKTADLPAAYFMRGMALEDAKDYEPAAAAYAKALALYRAYPNANAKELTTVRTRLGIARAAGQNSKARDKFTVRGTDGKRIRLRIKRRAKIKSPKVDGNRRVDGARAIVRITLGPDAKPAQIDIVQSDPAPEFGEAMRQAMMTWSFEPEQEGLAPEQVPPFEYSMSFSIARR